MNLIYLTAKKRTEEELTKDGHMYSADEIKALITIKTADLDFCLSIKHKPKPSPPRRIRRELLELIWKQEKIENLTECARIAFQATSLK